MSLSILQSVGINAVNQIADVKLIQVLLNSHIHWKALYIHVKVDGHAGDKTKEAIKRFQREMMNRKPRWPCGP